MYFQDFFFIDCWYYALLLILSSNEHFVSNKERFDILIDLFKTNISEFKLVTQYFLINIE